MNFDRHAGTYVDEVEEAVAFAGAGARFYTEVKAALVVELARRALGDPGSLEVLDAGCGPGETDAFLEGAFRGLSGVDVSKAMIEAAAERNPWASYRSFSPGEAFPHPDASFDLTFAICVLHHLEPPERTGFVKELARVTKQSGVVAIFEHNPRNPGTRKVVRDCPFDHGVRLLPMAETLSLLSAPGLEVFERRFILLFPWRGGLLRRIERWLSRLPAGAQYYVAASKRPATL
jgi:SAM-dependent methyltransferase